MIESSANPVTASLGQQMTNLEDIRQLASDDERAALKKATEQFEALFVQMMLKTMRSTTGENSLHSSSATKTFQDMQDSEMAKQISAAGGIGLTQQVLDSVFQQAGIEEETISTDNSLVQTETFLQQRGGVNP